MSLKLAGFLTVLTCGPLWADFDPDAYPRYETCALCHGLYGVSHTARFPHLAGQKPAYIEAQLRAFLAGARTNDGGQMAAIVTELQPGDIAIVVEWFSSQDPPPAATAPETENGAKLYAALECAVCHGQPEQAEVPFLTAQHSGYLAKQMTDFRDARRTLPEVAQVHAELLSIEDEAIVQIADYLAAQER